MIEQVVSKLLRTSTPITSVVSQRISYAERPGVEQSFDPPALIVQRITRNSVHHFHGASGVAQGSVRVTALANSYLGASDLAELVLNRLDGFAGTVTVTLADDSTRDVGVGFIKLEDESDIPTDHRDGQGRALTHGIQLDFRFQHREPVPTLT